MDEFRAGVTATLRSWSSLRTAIESGWGGSESKEKAEDLRDNISCFPPKMDQCELEDNLFDYMEHEFSIVLEDGSEKQVADVLMRMYEGCHRGDATLARQMVAMAQKAEEALKSYPVQIQSNPEDDDDDDDNGDANMEEDVQAMSTTDASAATTLPVSGFVANEYAAGSLFGAPVQNHALPAIPSRQLGESVPEKPTREVDDDGFAAVVPRSRKR